MGPIPNNWPEMLVRASTTNHDYIVRKEGRIQLVAQLDASVEKLSIAEIVAISRLALLTSNDFAAKNQITMAVKKLHERKVEKMNTFFGRVVWTLYSVVKIVSMMTIIGIPLSRYIKRSQDGHNKDLKDSRDFYVEQHLTPLLAVLKKIEIYNKDAKTALIETLAKDSKTTDQFVQDHKRRGISLLIRDSTNKYEKSGQQQDCSDAVFEGIKRIIGDKAGDAKWLLLAQSVTTQTIGNTAMLPAMAALSANDWTDTVYQGKILFVRQKTLPIVINVARKKGDITAPISALEVSSIIKWPVITEEKQPPIATLTGALKFTVTCTQTNEPVVENFTLQHDFELLEFF